MIYGVYDNSARVHWPPSKIFGDEIKVKLCAIRINLLLTFHSAVKIIGSFAQTYCFPRAVAYLDSGRVIVKGMVIIYFLLQNNTPKAYLNP